jgi:predicted dehydrogenase
MPENTGQTRRNFVTATIGAGAALNLNPRAMGANDRISLALIGARNQGKGVGLRSIAAGARIATICDIDDAIYAAVAPMYAEKQGEKPAYVKDFRRVLEDKNIDAIIIATPDHWHTHMSIPAMQAGKDVYLEKPVSQTIQEGRLIRDATRKYKRVVQVGTMRRSGEHFQEAALQVSKVGKLCLVRTWMAQVRESIGNPADGAPPAGVDYEKWLGPAPLRPFNQNRFHYNWRFFYDYGNTELGNQGVHMLDVALMGIQHVYGVGRSLPRRVSSQGGIYWLKDAKEVPDTQATTFDYGDFLLTWELTSFSKSHPVEGAYAGTAFYGTEGTLIVDGRGWKLFGANGKPTATGDAKPMTHEKNFLECMRSRKAPNAEIEIGRLSTTLCHLGNISQKLGRDVRFDAKTETFGDDKQANALLAKTYRKGYDLPKLT